MYSLVSASVLAIDLSLHPSGAAVADAVDRVLALTSAELARMELPAPKAVRERVLDACSGQAGGSTVLDAVAGAVAHGLPGLEAGRTMAAALEQTLVGGVTDLLELLAHEAPLVDAAPAARQVSLDGVTAAWAGRLAPLADLTLLREPWQRALDPVPAVLPVTAWSPALGALLDAISRRTTHQWQRVVDAHGAHRGTLAWSTAMHRACRAAFEADRLEATARAQLAAARGLRLSGASTGPEARGIAMAVTAAVQATCTRDLVDDDVTTALISAWAAGS